MQIYDENAYFLQTKRNLLLQMHAFAMQSELATNTSDSH
jgi:hypothetical protein